MGKSHYTVETIVAIREAEVLLAKGQTLAKMLRQIVISDATYYKWRKEYSGLHADRAKRYKKLEQDHQRQKHFIRGRLPILTGLLTYDWCKIWG